MNTSLTKNILGIGAALSLMSGCAGEANKETTSQSRPNILFIPIDDLRPDLGCYGDQFAITPNIDRIASQGVIFTNAYCQQAVCNPSRASLFCGLRPDSLRVWDLRTSFRKNLPDVITLPQYFKNNDYYTVGIGKNFHNTIPDTISWTEKPHINSFPFDPDAVYLLPENIARSEEKKQEYINRGINRVDQLGHWYIKTVATENADVPDDAYFDGAQTTLAIEKLNELKDKNQPFFLSVGYYRPHLPFNAPQKYWDMYNRDSVPLAKNQFVPKDNPAMALNKNYELKGYEDFKDTPFPDQGSLSEERQRLLKHGYYASVSYVDAQIGRLLDELERLGLKENTIIVLWGDHGWKLGEHNAWSKQTNYEIDTRVPMIVAGANVKSKGEECNKLTEFVDIYPTLCDMAGLEIPSHLQGLSMLPLLNNTESEWKNAAFSQFLQGRFGPKENRINEYMGYSIRTKNYRYVEWYSWDKEKNEKIDFVDREMYDHRTDPEENTNVAMIDNNKDIIEQLSKRLKSGWRAALPQKN